METIRFFALGGLDENGKNSSVIEIGDEIYVIDTGIKYPESVNLGIEIVTPDFSYLEQNKDRVKGIFITHAHDDVLTALPYLVKKVHAPIYTTPLTAVYCEQLLRKHQIKNVKIHRIRKSGSFRIGNRKFRSFGITHSIPDAFGLAIHTQCGNIVFSGESIIDFDVTNKAFACDITEFAEIGKEGVFLLTAESVGADRSGFTAPRHRLSDQIDPVFASSEGRIIVTLYEQNIYRVIEIIEMAVKYQRKLFFYNPKQRELIRQLAQLNLYHIPAGIEITQDRFSNDLEDLVIIVSATGPAVFRMMNRIATGEDDILELHESDTVIVASPVVPGTEKEASTMENELYKDNVRVVNFASKELLSMHATQEDLKMLLFLFKPKYYIPVKGSYRQLVTNANIALEKGMNAANILVLDNGQVAEFADCELKDTTQIIKLDDVMIDGDDHLDASGLIIRDRQTLSTDGVLVLGIVINHKTKEIIGGPDVQTRGLVYLKDADYIIKEAGNIMEKVVLEAANGKKFENATVRMDVRDKVSKYIYKETGKRPMVLPAIIEINPQNL